MSFKRRNNNGNQRGGYGGSRRSGSNQSGGSYNRAPREMHKTTCSDCGNECEVPFVPTQGKPVYCRDCFQNHRSY